MPSRPLTPVLSTLRRRAVRLLAAFAALLLPAAALAQVTYTGTAAKLLRNRAGNHCSNHPRAHRRR